MSSIDSQSLQQEIVSESNEQFNAEWQQFLKHLEKLCNEGKAGQAIMDLLETGFMMPQEYLQNELGDNADMNSELSQIMNLEQDMQNRFNKFGPDGKSGSVKDVEQMQKDAKEIEKILDAKGSPFANNIAPQLIDQINSILPSLNKSQASAIAQSMASAWAENDATKTSGGSGPDAMSKYTNAFSDFQTTVQGQSQIELSTAQYISNNLQQFGGIQSSSNNSMNTLIGGIVSNETPQ